MSDRPTRLPEALRRQLDEAHAGLLRVHKALLDHERVRYERERGRIAGPGEFLQIVINDPWFAWLRPVSELIVRIDEFSASKGEVDPLEGEALLGQARELLVPAEEGGGGDSGGAGGGASEFQRQYGRALRESPEASLAHGEWRLFALRTGRRGA
jgi:hypothetical protein